MISQEKSSIFHIKAYENASRDEIKKMCGIKIQWIEEPEVEGKKFVCIVLYVNGFRYIL